MLSYRGSSQPRDQTHVSCVSCIGRRLLDHQHHLESLLSAPEVKVKVAQSCPTLCDPMDYTVHGILQARILEWVAFPFSRGSSQPRDRTQVSHITGRFFTTREAQDYWSG